MPNAKWIVKWLRPLSACSSKSYGAKWIIDYGVDYLDSFPNTVLVLVITESKGCPSFQVLLRRLEMVRALMDGYIYFLLVFPPLVQPCN